MPTYEYRCKSCDDTLEVVQAFTDDPLTECPSCGGPLRKVFGNIGITFKGSGFYKTDSRNGKGSGQGSSESKESASKESSSESSSSDGSSKSSSDAASSSSSSSDAGSSGSSGSSSSSKAGASA